MNKTGNKDNIYIIKIGGNIIDDDEKLQTFLKAFVQVEGKKLLIHGGGKLATRMAEKMNIPQQLVDGRRITDAETLKIVTMVYAGFINKNIVATLQSLRCNAIGLCGPDGNVIKAHKRIHPTLDYGYVGDVDHIDTSLLETLLNQNLSVVIAPITHNGEAQLLNTNADTIAQEMAKALSNLYNVHLIYSFEKSGVLLNAEDDSTVIPQLKPSYYSKLKEEGAIFAGMIPKLDNAFSALSAGVTKVIIGKAEQLPQLLNGQIRNNHYS